MRPILKGASRKRSPNKASNGTTTLSPTPAKRDAVQFGSPSGRRVTFSPFAKPRRRLAPKRLQSDRVENGVVTSGFAFSAAVDKEADLLARRTRQMNLLQTLYKAACKPRLSWRALLEDHLPYLKTAQLKVSEWLHMIKEPLLAEARRRGNRRILRSRTRHAPPVYFDQTDRQFVQSVNAPLLPPTRTVAVDHAFRSAASLDSTNALLAPLPSSSLADSHAPMLTPANLGSLSTLLRREGIPATEDESRDIAAVRNDLRGVTHRATGLKLVPHHAELRLV